MKSIKNYKNSELWVKKWAGWLEIESKTIQTDGKVSSTPIEINENSSLPFILAFIEESGIDKRELIQKLVTEEDIRWLSDLRKWFKMKKIDWEKQPSLSDTKGITYDDFIRLQSKFGDKEGEEK